MDFLIAHHINMNDRLRGLARYAVVALRYWAVGGRKPLSLCQQINAANIDRQFEEVDIFEGVECYRA